MAGWQVDVHIFDSLESPPPEEWLRRVVFLTLDSEEPGEAPNPLTALAAAALQGDHPVALSLVIADDETLHALNRDYHGEDRVTDVLAFPFLEPEAASGDGGGNGAEVPFIVPADTGQVPITLGEVIVSYPQAVRQAGDAGHSVQQETALLIAHGVLHLLGYDHATPREQAAMWERQDAVLAKLFAQEGA